MASPMTLKELARLLNLAPSTVSRALKGHPDISKSTQERVKALAKKWHYRPNALAMGLRNHKFRLIAVIVPEITDYYYARVLHAIISYAYEENYKIVVFESQEKCKKEIEICRIIQKSGIDGLLVVPARTTIDTIHFEELKAMGLPLVFLERISGHLNVDRVAEDDYYGACIAMNYMIESGCKQIAHLAASPQWVWAQKRQMGYVQALLDHHLPVNRNLIVEYHDLDQIDKIVGSWIEHYNIDGIFAVDDQSAVRVMSVVQHLGFQIPRDMAVCGYGNEPIAEVVSPSLTTVERKGEIIGRYAVHLLIDRIEGKKSGETETKLWKNDLIVRDSTRSFIS